MTTKVYDNLKLPKTPIGESTLYLARHNSLFYLVYGLEDEDSTMGVVAMYRGTRQGESWVAMNLRDTYAEDLRHLLKLTKKADRFIVDNGLDTPSGRCTFSPSRPAEAIHLGD